MTMTPSDAGFASILTHFDLSAYCEARGRLAIQLADQHDAHFIGVGAEQQLLELYSDMSINVSATVSDEERGRVDGDLRTARRTFDAVVGSRSDVEWRSRVTEPERFLIEQARASDLVVIGRRASYEDGGKGLGVRPGNVVLECGRPVLIVPPETEYLKAHQVVVAWKDTREARRAVRDALPILRKANEVVVMTAAQIDPDTSADDVSIWLSRHGVSSRVSVHSGDINNIEDELIMLADEIGADLIVSGAYGHSRTREWFFGGVTRNLLETSKHCLFMSH